MSFCRLTVHTCHVCRNIVAFHGFGLQQPGELRSAFYVMDHLRGGSIKGLYHVRSKGAMRHAVFTINDAMRWAIQVSSALAYMHSGADPVIHRDIKLDNLLLDSKTHSKASVAIADFGLAVQLSHRRQHSNDEALAAYNAVLATSAFPLMWTVLCAQPSELAMHGLCACTILLVTNAVCPQL